MARAQAGFWDFEERLAALSAQGDPLESLAATVDFEIFRPVLGQVVLGQALVRRDPSKGGRPGFGPGFDLVLKFKMPVLQALHGVSLEPTEYPVRDRLSWMRICGLGLADQVPDADTLWDFGAALVAAKALDGLFARPDEAISEAGDQAMSGQILDEAMVAPPKQRNTEDQKAAIKAGKTAREIRSDTPHKAAQKDTDARWTVKCAKDRARDDGKSPISIDRRYRVIRRQVALDAATHDGAHDGARLREGLIDANTLGARVWADTACRAGANEACLEHHGKTGRIHHRKPKGKPMPRTLARGNATKSKTRALVEHVFAAQKAPMGLFIRTIGHDRAEAPITFTKMAYNIERWCRPESHAIMTWQNQAGPVTTKDRSATTPRYDR